MEGIAGTIGLPFRHRFFARWSMVGIGELESCEERGIDVVGRQGGKIPKVVFRGCYLLGFFA
jgi:hypothetical protein